MWPIFKIILSLTNEIRIYLLTIYSNCKMNELVSYTYVKLTFKTDNTSMMIIYQTDILIKKHSARPLLIRM